MSSDPEEIARYMDSSEDKLISESRWQALLLADHDYSPLPAEVKDLGSIAMLPIQMLDYVLREPAHPSPRRWMITKPEPHSVPGEPAHRSWVIPYVDLRHVDTSAAMTWVTDSPGGIRGNFTRAVSTRIPENGRLWAIQDEQAVSWELNSKDPVLISLEKPPQYGSFVTWEGGLH